MNKTTTEMTYDQFVTELEELGAGGYHAAQDCLAQEYPEFYQTYFDTVVFPEDA